MQNATADHPTDPSTRTGWFAWLAVRLRSWLANDASDPELSKEICAWDREVIQRGSHWRKS